MRSKVHCTNKTLHKSSKKKNVTDHASPRVACTKNLTVVPKQADMKLTNAWVSILAFCCAYTSQTDFATCSVQNETVYWKTRLRKIQFSDSIIRFKLKHNKVRETCLPQNSLPQVSGAYHDRMFVDTCIHAYRICDSRMEISCFATPSLPCIGDEEGLFLLRDCRRDIKSFKKLRSEQVQWRYLRWRWFITLSWKWVEYIFFSLLTTIKSIYEWEFRRAISRYLSDTSANASGSIPYLYKRMNVLRCKISFFE